MKRILVVDDELVFREAVVGVLRDNEYDVSEATNGKTAQDLMKTQEFDLVLSDIHMPTMGGIDLLKWIKAKGVSGDVIEIIYQHHEDMLGQGYPRHLLRARIHPLAKILYAADVYSDHAIASPHSAGENGPNTIVKVENLFGERIDKDVLTALKSLFN